MLQSLFGTQPNAVKAKGKHLKRPRLQDDSRTAVERQWMQQEAPDHTFLRDHWRRRTMRMSIQAAKDVVLEDNVRWIKNNVPIKSLPKALISQHTKMTTLVDVLKRIFRTRLHAAFTRWSQVIESAKHAEAVAAFVQSEAVRSLQCIWERSWLRRRNRCFELWRIDFVCSRAQEEAAAAAEIQRCARRYLRRDVLFHKHRHAAAVRIQSCYRRHAATLHFHRWLHEAKLDRAATHIQKSYRRKRARAAFLTTLVFYCQTEAAIVLQRWMRGSVFHLKWLRRRGAEVLAAEAATCIQRCIRAFLARQWFHRIRGYRSAQTIQRAWRRSRRRGHVRINAAMACLRREFDATMHDLGALVVQAVARGFLGRCRVRMLRKRLRCLLLLQATWRKYVVRQQQTKARHERRFKRIMAAHRIQAMFRGYQERRLFRMAISKSCVPMYLRASRIRFKEEQMRFRERFHEQIAWSAASVIETKWRQYVERREARRVKEMTAAEIIQRKFRSYRARRWFQAYAARVVKSAKSIQRMVRSRQERDRTKQYIAQMQRVVKEAQAVKMNQAARRVQAAWRRKQGRMAHHLRKMAQEEMNQHRVHSAKKIQAFVRRRRHLRQNKRNMAAAMANISQMVAARHNAAKKFQRNYRAYHAGRLGKAMLRSLKLSRRKKERRLARQRIIAEYLVEASAERSQETDLLAKTRANHEKIQAEKDRKEAEARAAKAERRRQALLAAEKNVRPVTILPSKKKASKTAWIEAWDGDGNKYFYNPETGESRWTIE
ncbi:hypothetical protein LEN26_017283 [Aphanomyces euteiches]|nr:hypothetical protein LEN26_017283 [Aphanomyces euteiches]KAH9124754.1 hypothetical protein AeMF1_004528 [Aphanomyces euteiches]KAH9188142.1 hypothetical protein AeNC1_009878 [Aphanomyces euteiches]